MNDITNMPIDCVWEVTMGCNMHCMHCGSACSSPMKDELSTEDALKLIDQMKAVGLKGVTLSGGEPTTRKDIFILAESLRKNNILVSMISNGWLIDEDMIDKLIKIGMSNISMSLDGLEYTHDLIRKKGAFKRVMNTLDLLHQKGLSSGIITTVNKMNIDELPLIWEVLKQKFATHWQVQISLPMGNLKDNEEMMMLEPKDLEKIISYLYGFMKTSKDGNPKIYLGDNIGYYNTNEVEIKAKQTSYDDAIWSGCGAGKSGFGVLHNGDIVPCTSLRSKEYIEGNIKNCSLVDLWENGFKKFRQFSADKLEGLCLDCMYSTMCKGGCTNSRFCVQGKINSENIYCLYNFAVKQECESIPYISDFSDIKKLILKYDNEENYQVLNYYIQGIIESYVYDKEKYIFLLNALAYSYFRMELYDKAIRINE
ncbi:MAG: radical SAM protein [Clostridium sp.]